MQYLKQPICNNVDALRLVISRHLGLCQSETHVVRASISRNPFVTTEAELFSGAVQHRAVIVITANLPPCRLLA